ncbi:MAG: hypothetical protein R2715_18555 [Ilumatobacteraceae bacterium]
MEQIDPPTERSRHERDGVLLVDAASPTAEAVADVIQAAGLGLACWARSVDAANRQLLGPFPTERLGLVIVDADLEHRSAALAVELAHRVPQATVLLVSIHGIDDLEELAAVPNLHVVAKERLSPAVLRRRGRGPEGGVVRSAQPGGTGTTATERCTTTWRVRSPRLTRNPAPSRRAVRERSVKHMETTLHSTTARTTSTTDPTACPPSNRRERRNRDRRDRRNRRRHVVGIAVVSLAGIMGSAIAAPLPARAETVAVEVTAQPWEALGIRADATATTTWFGDARVLIAGGFSVQVGTLSIPMPDGAVVLQKDAAGGWQVASGYAALPVPDIGVLAGASMTKAPFARFGRATGAQLRHLDAHLRDESTYWYFQFDGSVEFDLPLVRQLGLGVLAGAMASGGGPGLLVVEDHGTYAYFGGDCPNPPTKISKGGTKGTSKVSQARAARMQQASKQLTEAERVKAARRKQLADVSRPPRTSRRS